MDDAGNFPFADEVIEKFIMKPPVGSVLRKNSEGGECAKNERCDEDECIFMGCFINGFERGTCCRVEVATDNFARTDNVICLPKVSAGRIVEHVTGRMAGHILTAGADVRRRPAAGPIWPA